MKVDIRSKNARRSWPTWAGGAASATHHAQALVVEHLAVKDEIPDSITAAGVDAQRDLRGPRTCSASSATTNYTSRSTSAKWDRHFQDVRVPSSQVSEKKQGDDRNVKKTTSIRICRSIRSTSYRADSHSPSMGGVLSRTWLAVLDRSIRLT